jgi:DNA-binding GntR family transcriptional regulator
VYDALKREIAEFRIKPGERLIESELSRQYDVSRTPVREALQRLEQEGLVVALAGGRVARPFDLREFEDIYRLRIEVECLAVAQSCERAPAEAIAQIRGVWDRWYAEAADGDGYDHSQIESRVHLGIARLSQNEMLIATLQRINDRIVVIRRTDFLEPGRIAETQAQHNAILAAIDERDVEGGSELMRVHIVEAQANISRLVSGALAQTYMEA